MKILILGAGGMIGRKLVDQLLIVAADGHFPSELILHDIVQPEMPASECKIICLAGNVADPDEVSKLAAMRPDVIYHLAAIVSGEAERDFDKGWNVNMRGGWHLLEALRKEHMDSGGIYTPRLVFSSSIAVFGGPYPSLIPDDFQCAPQTSYGAQKAMCELLVSEYTRKGIVDGLSLRLPTITVRPGKPNQAASSFYSGIIREPLNGEEAILPVPDKTRHWFASPRSAVRFLQHAGNLNTAPLGSSRSLNMPAVSCTVAQQIEALRNVAGNEAVKHIVSKPDEDIMRIVGGWPEAFDPKRANALGFVAEQNFEEIIRVYLEDDFRK
ncbi:MAG: D-erythronate dehydrogenase [Pseudomonadota bacterium]